MMLTDPRLFNYIIMVVFLLAAARWAYERQWADVIYWVCSFGLTAAITWGYQR